MTAHCRIRRRNLPLRTILWSLPGCTDPSRRQAARHFLCDKQIQECPHNIGHLSPSSEATRKVYSNVLFCQITHFERVPVMMVPSPLYKLVLHLTLLDFPYPFPRPCHENWCWKLRRYTLICIEHHNNCLTTCEVRLI